MLCNSEDPTAPAAILVSVIALVAMFPSFIVRPAILAPVIVAEEISASTMVPFAILSRYSSCRRG